MLDLRYGYDGVGNILNLRDRTGGGDELQTFTYDDLDRLTGVSGPCSQSYSYDAIGNLTYRSDVGAYSYNSGRPHAVTAAGSHSYGYDENGNMISRAGDPLTYDAENRLQSVTSGSETVSFTYDGDGRRVLRDTDTDTTAYVGSHYELRFDKQPMPEDLDNDCQVTVIDIMRVAAQWGQAGGPEDLDGSGTVDVGDIQQVAGAWRDTCHVLAEVVKYYALGGQRIAMRQAGTLYYLFTDHLGSTSVTFNTTNSQTQTLRYYPWGTVRSGDIPADRRFTGQRWDATIDLYDYQARFYDPALGRFVQPDTIVPEPGNPQDLNRYSYVRNNPLTYNDPSGHAAPYRPIEIEIRLPAWAQSGLMRRALSVGCFFLSCHVDAERGVLTGPTPEEQITMAIQPMPMSVASGTAGNLADDIADDIMRAGAEKFEQKVLPGFEELVPEVSEGVAQSHHILSKKIMRVLNRHETLRGLFDRDDLMSRAIDEQSHRGYQTWHRLYDDEVVRWLSRNRESTRKQFLKFLQEIYERPEMRRRFPDASDLIQQALEAEP